MFWSKAFGVFVPFIIPSTHIIILSHFWSSYAVKVKRDDCTCSCWDTVYKAAFESGLTTSYKHMYFNATPNILYIWFLIVIAIIATYEGFKKSIWLIHRGSARLPMVGLFCTAVVSLYIAWWDLINYINDDYYNQLNYQLWMSSIEIISTALVLNLVNTQVYLRNKKLAIISILGAARMMLRFYNDFYGLWVFSDEEPGDLYELRSDLIKGVPDLVHFLIPIFVMQKNLSVAQNKRRKKKQSQAYTMGDIFCIFNTLLFFATLTLVIVFRNMFM